MSDWQKILTEGVFNYIPPPLAEGTAHYQTMIDWAKQAARSSEGSPMFTIEELRALPTYPKE